VNGQHGDYSRTTLSHLCFMVCSFVWALSSRGRALVSRKTTLITPRSSNSKLRRRRIKTRTLHAPDADELDTLPHHYGKTPNSQASFSPPSIETQVRPRPLILQVPSRKGRTTLWCIRVTLFALMVQEERGVGVVLLYDVRYSARLPCLHVSNSL
jgi:hypothetical protein